MDNKHIIQLNNIQNRIFTVRGKQIMLDSDLAELYFVETKILNRAVTRNINRFPENFRFQLTKEEYSNLRIQNGTSSTKRHGGRRYMPYAFTEQGVSMLSAVLKSDIAIEVSIKIIESFVNMRKLLSSNTLLFDRFERIENKLSLHDDNFNKIFDAIESKEIKPKQGIFYNGQIFDAYIFIADLIKTAKHSIVLIDNYIDESVLTLLSKRNKNCTARIYTQSITKQLKLDLQKHNCQYPDVTIETFKKAHDRFLIIDQLDIYHIGASLKDLGKKWFAFSKFEIGAVEMLDQLKADGYE